MSAKLTLIPLLALLGLACRSGYNETGGSYDDTGSDWSPDSDVESDRPDTEPPPPPPEVEDDLPLLTPAQTDTFVFIANPDRDTLTRVHVQAIDVLTVPVGRDPLLVRTTPNHQRAVVFNRGDDSLSIVEAHTLAVRTVGLRRNHNAMVVGPDSAWIAAFHDQKSERPGDPAVSGMQSFNEVSFVHLDSGRHVGLAVGYNPRSVQFTEDGNKAVVVTDTHLALVDLTAANPRPQLLQVASSLLDPPEAEEVVLSKSGHFAFVRQFGATDIAVVDLRTGALERIPVGQNPTDLDLTPDGATAVVVCRDDHELWLLDAVNPHTSEPVVVPLPDSLLLGSVSFEPSGRQAILYSTAVAQARYATWTLATNEIRVRSLVKPVKGVSITPTGSAMLVFHPRTDTEDVDPASPFRNRWAITLIDLLDHRANPLLLPSEPTGFAHGSTGERGFFIMEDQALLEALDYRSLLHTEVRLRSLPLFVGVLPDLTPNDGVEPRAWVSQAHPLGRITLYGPQDGSVETLTGFELNAQIED